MCANFALEVLPDERADALVLSDSAFLLPQPSLQTVEVDEAGIALACTRIYQWILRIITCR